MQLLQLVHGRADELLRSVTTLTALSDLAAGGGRRSPGRCIAGRGVPVPAHSGEPAPATAPTCCRWPPPTCAGRSAAWDFDKIRLASCMPSTLGTPAKCGGCTKNSCTVPFLLLSRGFRAKRCICHSMPLLTARGARIRRSRERAAPPGSVDERRQPSSRNPAHPVAVMSVVAMPPIRTRVAWPFARSLTRWGIPTGTCARAGCGGTAPGIDLGPAAGTRPTCSCMPRSSVVMADAGDGPHQLRPRPLADLRAELMSAV